MKLKERLDADPSVLFSIENNSMVGMMYFYIRDRSGHMEKLHDPLQMLDT